VKNSYFGVQVITRLSRSPQCQGLELAWDSATNRTVYLSAGIHGDELAVPLTLLELLRADALPRQDNWVICPLMNL